MTGASNNPNRTQVAMILLPHDFFHMGNRVEDIAAIRGMRFSLDDDNEIAHKNVP